MHDSDNRVTRTNTHFMGWLIVSIAAVFYCYEYFLRIAPSVMAEEIRESFNIDATIFGFLMAFYYYAYTPMQIPVGLLMDRFNPKRLLVYACIVCVLGTFMFVYSHGLLFEAQVGRFMIGFGSAFAFVGVLKLASDWLPPESFALVSGLTTALAMAGAMAGDYLLEWMTDNFGWQQSLLIAAYIGMLLSLVLMLLPNKHTALHKIQERPKRLSLKAYLNSFFNMLNYPYLWLVGAIGGILFLSLSAFAELWGIEYLQKSHHLSKVVATSANSMVFFGWLIGAPLVGFVAAKFQRLRSLLFIGTSLATVTSYLVVFGGIQSASTLHCLLFLLGVFCSTEILVFTIARNFFTRSLAGASIALTNMMVMISGMVFQPLIGRMLDMHWAKHPVVNPHGNPLYSSLDFKYAMSCLPFCLLLATVMVLFLKEAPQEQTLDQAQASEAESS